MLVRLTENPRQAPTSKVTPSSSNIVLVAFRNTNVAQDSILILNHPHRSSSHNIIIIDLFTIYKYSILKVSTIQHETYLQHFHRGTATSPRANVRCPLSAVHCPLSAVRCPLSAVRCPLSAVRCPLSAVRCPVRCPLSCPLSAVHCPLSAVGCPMRKFLRIPTTHPCQHVEAPPEEKVRRKSFRVMSSRKGEKSSRRQILIDHPFIPFCPDVVVVLAFTSFHAHDHPGTLTDSHHDM